MTTKELAHPLTPLDDDAVREVAARLKAPSRLSREQRRSWIADLYASNPRAVLDALQRADLIVCLDAWRHRSARGELRLDGQKGAPVKELRAVAQSVWIDRWAPTRDGEPSPASPRVTAARVWTALDVVRAIRAKDQPEVAAADDAESVKVVTPAYDVVETRLGAASRDERRVALEDFQQEAVTALRASLARGDRALLCLPTGGGKTRTALALLLEDVVAAGRRVVWVTHRLDLLDQVHDDIRDLAWCVAQRRARFAISHVGGGAADTRGDFILASAMTLVRNRDALREIARQPDLDVVVYDEAHRLLAPGTLDAMRELLTKGRKLLTLTATPFRRDEAETEELRRVLGPVTYEKTFVELVRAGFLARPEFFQQVLRSTAAVPWSEGDASAGPRDDFTRDELSAIARTPGRDQEIVDHWRSRRAKYRKTLVFACDIEHAEHLAKTFADDGTEARALHSGMPSDARREALRWFRDHTGSPVLVNVGILTEGANIPDTRTVLLARPTLSRVLYLQMIGRGARGPRACPGKETFCVIDCVDNFGLHGPVTAGTAVMRELDAATATLAALDAPRRSTPPAPVGVTARSNADRAEDFTTIAFALATKARGEAPAAAGLVRRSCEALFGVTSPAPDFVGRVPDDVLRAAASHLAEGQPHEQRAAVMDHLLRVVMADQVVDTHEREVLGVVAPTLGMSTTALEDRLAAIDAAPGSRAEELAQQESSGTNTCRVCRTVWPDDAAFCGECGSKLAASHAGRRVDPREGYAFEEWFAKQLKGLGFDDVRKNPVAHDGPGRLDFVVSHGGRQMELELKHIGPRSEVFHWSQHQVGQAQRRAGDGYHLVIGRRIGEDRYDLFWCARPHEVFRERVREIRHRYERTHAVTHTPGADVWGTKPPSVEPDGGRHTLEFVVEVTERDYEALRKEGTGFDPLVRWRDMAS